MDRSLAETRQTGKEEIGRYLPATGMITRPKYKLGHITTLQSLYNDLDGGASLGGAAAGWAETKIELWVAEQL